VGREEVRGTFAGRAWWTQGVQRVLSSKFMVMRLPFSSVGFRAGAELGNSMGLILDARVESILFLFTRVRVGVWLLLYTLPGAGSSECMLSM